MFSIAAGRGQSSIFQDRLPRDTTIEETVLSLSPLATHSATAEIYNPPAHGVNWA